MKTTLLTIAAFFVLTTTRSQSFSENFNSATIASLEASCWILSGSLTTTQIGEAINSNSISSLPATNTNAKTDVYTPILNVTSSTPTVSFDYRLTSSLNGNATRKIEVGFVTTTGSLVVSHIVNLVAGTNTDVKQYNHTFSSLIPGNYRVVIRLSGSNGNGNARIVFDNFVTSNASPIFVSPGTCLFTPIVETTLPIKLSYFTAQLNNNSVDLKWATSTEINFSHFVIERSYNGVDYSDIATVFGAGNSTDIQKYEFSDKSFTTDNKVAYYRLRQVDIDAKEEFSATRIIHLNKQNNNSGISILAYPNPVSNELRITVPNNWQGKKVNFEVINANGQLVRTAGSGSSSQTETINVNTLAPGFYIIKASCNGEIAQQRIIKQ